MKFTNLRIPAALLAVACSIASLAPVNAGSPGNVRPAEPPATGKSGAQLWAENCNRCHNVRSPQSYSPAQWDVAMLHMRVRANLTGDEARKILAFLKSAS